MYYSVMEWNSGSPDAACQTGGALLHHGQVPRGDVDRHAGVLDEQILHGAGLGRGSLCSETGGRGDKPALVHAAALQPTAAATAAVAPGARRHGRRAAGPVGRAGQRTTHTY